MLGHHFLLQTNQHIFAVGDKVYVRNFRRGPVWLPGCIVQMDGQSSVHIQLDDGRIFQRHQNHVRPRTVESERHASQLETDAFISVPSRETESPTEGNESSTPGCLKCRVCVKVGAYGSDWTAKEVSLPFTPTTCGHLSEIGRRRCNNPTSFGTFRACYVIIHHPSCTARVCI